MKLICTQENLKKAIYNSERVVSKQTTLPILNNILFETDKSGLRLSATNLEIGVQVKIGAKVEKEGSITIPAKLISNFSNNLSTGESVSLEVNDQTLKIKSGRVRAVIKGMSANDFPLIPKRNTEFFLTIPATKMKVVLGKVLNSVAFSEARPELTGINIILGEEELRFASTDSFRLSECILKKEEISVTEDYFSFISRVSSIIIPATTLLELNRIISNEVEGEVKISIEESQIFFEVDDTVLVSRLINGKYPEYKHIMPESYATRIVGEKSMFQNAVKMASVFASTKSSEISLRIDSEPKKILIGASSVETGENSTELNFDVAGPDQEVVFNSKYLIDGINSVTTSKAAMLLNSPTTPVAIREIDEKTGEVLENYTYIVMPIKN